jgi:NADH-quinone oxidoreductase subunit J
MLDSVLFYFFAGVAIVSAALLVTRRNPIYSAVFLITTLLATAGIFLQLHAEFLFITQIMVYVSGAVILFLFVILLLRLDISMPKTRVSKQKWVSLAIAGALGSQVAAILWASHRMPGHGLFVRGAAPADQLPPNAEDLAQSLFNNYLLPFEIVGVLLLIAMIGAVVMAKKRTELQ